MAKTSPMAITAVSVLSGAGRRPRPPNGNWTKRDSSRGRFMDQKQDGKPFKGVRRES